MKAVRNGSVRTFLVLGLVIIMAGSALAANIYDFTLPSIDGKPMPLAEFKGKVVLVVNVASRCGYTPQYSALEALYEKYKDQGFVIVGFPANNFGAQEPGTNEEIKTFCSRKYNVTFPMYSKVSVKGDDQTPLYQYLTKQTGRPSRANQVELHQISGRPQRECGAALRIRGDSRFERSGLRRRKTVEPEISAHSSAERDANFA